MRQHNMIGFLTLTYRECHRFLRLANQTIIPPIITAVLYILIFGYSLGSRIRSIGEVSYLAFLVPGLVMMSVITSSYSNTSSSLYIARFQGNIEELLVSSMSTFEIVMGFLLGGVFRGLAVGVGVAGVALLMADIPILHIGITLFFVVCVAFIFSCAGFISGIWAEDFDRLSLFQTYLLTPLTYLGGVFFSVDMLPGLWRGVALSNPILYFVNGLRYGFLELTDVHVGLAAAIAIGVSVILFAICYRLVRMGYNLKT